MVGVVGTLVRNRADRKRVDAAQPGSMAAPARGWRTDHTLDLALVGCDRELLADDVEGEIDWYRNDQPILPLHALQSADSPRVRAHRRRLRSGERTPLLLWWVAGLSAFVLLDGHARLAAAIAEDISPPMLILTASTAPELVSPRSTGEAAAIERAARMAGKAPAAHLAAVEQMIAEARLLRTERPTTYAWPLPGGRDAWDVEVRRSAPDRSRFDGH